MRNTSTDPGKGVHALKSIVPAFVVTAALGATMMATMSSANATAMLRLTDNTGATVTVADGSAFDFNPLVGAVTYAGAVGGWTVNMSTGFSKPVIGNSDKAVLDVSSFNLSSGVGTLTIEFSDDGFSLPVGGQWFSTGAIGGTTVGTVDYDGYRDASNALFGHGEHISDLGTFTAGAFSGQDHMTLSALANPFSMTQVITITHQVAGRTSFNAELVDPTNIPEPGTMAVFGLGLIGLGYARRKRQI